MYMHTYCTCIHAYGACIHAYYLGCGRDWEKAGERKVTASQGRQKTRRQDMWGERTVHLGDDAVGKDDLFHEVRVDMFFEILLPLVDGEVGRQVRYLALQPPVCMVSKSPSQASQAPKRMPSAPSSSSVTCSPLGPTHEHTRQRTAHSQETNGIFRDNGPHARVRVDWALGMAQDTRH